MPLMRLSEINQKFVVERCGHQEMPHNAGIGMEKMGKVMREYKAKTLHSGKSGKIVKKRSQAVAIALSEARKAGAKIPIKK